MENQNQSLAAFLEIEEPVAAQEVTPLQDFLKEEEEEQVAGDNPPPPPLPEEPKEDIGAPKPKPKEINSKYTERVKEYLEEGDWDDVQIEIEDEQGNPTTVKLSELSEIDADTFKQLKAAQKELKEQELKTKFISVEGLDETTKKLIEAKRAGADISQLIETDANLIHPLKEVDVDDPKIQEQIIRWSLQNKGEEADDIEYKIQKYKKNFTLDSEAGKIVKTINEEYDHKVTTALEEQKKANAEALESQKTFKKSISETYKNWKLNENTIKTLVDNSAKFDETGLTQVDRLYFEAKKNPELFAEIAFHIIDQKGFDEFKGVKIKNAVAKETILKISRIPKNASSAPTKKTEEETIDPLEKFFTQTI